MATGSIKAHVQCTIEIPVGLWGGGMTDIDKLTEQVRKEGESIVRQMAQEREGRLVGSPKVIFIVLNDSNNRGRE
jgi:hypothetical protein